LRGAGGVRCADALRGAAAVPPAWAGGVRRAAGGMGVRHMN